MNRIEIPKIISHSYNQYLKMNYNYSIKKGPFLKLIVLGKLNLQMQKFETRPYTLTKNQLTTSQALNLRPKTNKLLEWSIGKVLQDTGLGRDYLDNVWEYGQLKGRKYISVDYIKWSCFCITKKHSTKWRGNGQNGIKYLLPTHLIKD